MSDARPLRKLISLNEETAQRLDNFRFGKRIGSESEALRQLIKIGLDQVEAAPAAER
jgi:hypothetical protein